jgi:hypothetical protein
MGDEFVEQIRLNDFPLENHLVRLEPRDTNCPNLAL